MVCQYRYERKFAICELDRPQVASIVRLNSAMFRKIFQRRWINNIYLDTWTMNSYQENVAGAGDDRVKIRIRWYGHLFGPVERPVLELKIRQGLVNRKESFPLESFVVNEELSLSRIRNLFRRGALPEPLRHDLLKLQPMLLNRYDRSYFRSADRAYRVTIDSDMSFRRVTSNGNTFLAQSVDGEGIVLELKYARERDPYAEKITQQFPFRLTRSSKYVNGVERLLM